MMFEFSFEEQSTRKASVYAIIIAVAVTVLQYFLKPYGYFEYFFGGFISSLIFGFLAGLIIYKSRNAAAHIIPLILLVAPSLMRERLWFYSSGDYFYEIPASQFTLLLFVMGFLVFVNYLMRWVQSAKLD